MSGLEKLHLKLGLSGTYWDKRPSFRINLNDQVLHSGTIQADSDVTEYLEFDVETADDLVTLSITLLDKEFSDTVENDDKTAIVKDMLLNIVSVEVDDIALGMVPFNMSEYRPEGRTDVVKNCMNLGWNGTWSLTWDNPFYIWLLENM
jgi:hypothetical protein